MSLFDREMLFVTGKGGVGKSTVAAALGLAAARAGRRTIVCELAGQARIAPLLGAPAGALHAEQYVADGLWAMRIQSWRVLEEWVGRMLGSKALTALLTRSNFFRTFAEAVPGGMELGDVVKTWELVQDERWDRRAAGYDLVIVDGPASGHAVGMLRTPGTFADIARVGPIASQSERVREWLTDPVRTAYVAVAAPAELAVAETIDLGRRLRRGLGRRLEAIVVNGVLPDRFEPGEVEAVAACAADPRVAAAVRSADRRAAEQAEHRARLADEAAAGGQLLVELPFAFVERLGPEDVSALSARLAVA